MTPYYQDDAVTLYLGDCREVTDWLDADVLVTDPPYGRAWRQGSLKGHANEFDGVITGDHDLTVRDDALALWGGKPGAVFGDLMLSPPIQNRQTLIYRKPKNAGLRGAMVRFRRDVEAVYLIGGVGQLGTGLGGRTSILETAASKVGSGTGLGGRSGHPNEKPIDVLSVLITAFDFEAGRPAIVADPFVGSGSTLVAAKILGNRAIGVEIEERYCEIAAKRLAQDVLDFGAAS